MSSIEPQVRFRVEITVQSFDGQTPNDERRIIYLQEVETYLPVAQVIAAVNSFELAETTAPEVG